MKRILQFILAFAGSSAAFAQPCTSPPAADLCANAPNVCNLNNFCGNTTANTAGVPTTICGFSIENNAFVAFTATSPNVSFTITRGTCTSGSGIQAVILQTSNCTNFTAVSNCANNITGSAVVTSNTPLVVGQTYLVMIDGYAGADCNYSISNATGTGGTTATILASNDVTICAGQSTTLTASGSSNITWSPAAGLNTTSGGTITASPVVTTKYYAFDSTNPCAARDSVTVTVNTLDVPALTVVDAACTCDGQASILPSSTGIGQSPYTFSWSNGTTNDTVSSLCPGGYSVTMTDANGCAYTESFTINVTGGPVSVTSTQTVSCAGGSDGVATVTPSSGTPPYVYSWSNGDLDSVATGLAAGTYSVVVSDINGCQSVENVTIGEPQPLVITPSQTDVSCLGGSNGSATATVSGGNSPYLFTWSNGGTGSTLNNLSAGSYTVTVTDIKNCSAQHTFTITEPSQGISVTPFVTNVTCAGDSNGAITVTPSGGSGSYTYSWSVANENSNTIDSLPAGTYMAFVTDAAGCTGTSSIVVTEPTNILLTFQVDPARCFGSSDGSVTVTPSGGTPAVSGYSYSWSNGTISQQASGLLTGFISVTVTDSTGCSVTDSVFVPQPLPLVSSVTESPATCAIPSNGSAQVAVSGGTPGVNGYAYSWSNGATTQAIHSLTQGTFYVTITDSLGCVKTDSAVISMPLLSVLFNYSDPLCIGSASGWIKATASGGTGPYSYSWSNGLSGDSISGLTAGSYTVTVQDSGSLSPVLVYQEEFEAGMNWMLNVPTGPNSSSSNLWYFGPAFNAAGVCGSPGASDSILYVGRSSAPGAGVYYDSTFASNVSVVSPWISTIGYGSGLELNFDYMGSGNSDDIASVDVSTDGGQSWINLQTGLTSAPCANTAQWTSWNGLLPASAENNSKVVLRFVWRNNDDSTGTSTSFAVNNVRIFGEPQASICSVSATQTITDPARLSVVLTASQNANCSANNGALTVSGNGGTAPYQFNWSNGQTGATASSLLPNTPYTVTVTDANGCMSDSSFQITRVNATFNVSVNTTDAICLSATGSAIATVSGGGTTAPYTFNWFPGNITSNPAVNLIGGNTYQLTIRDANGCQFDTVVTIGITNSNLGLNLATTENICGQQVGKATVIPTAGTGPYTYSWDAAAMSQTTMQAINLGTGNYAVQVQDANGCISDTVVTITEVLAVNASFSTSSNNGIAPHSVQFTNTSTGADNYSWDFADAATSTETSPLHEFQAGVFQVVLYAYAGANDQCIDTAMVTITVLDKLQIYIPNVFAPSTGSADNRTFRITGEGIKEFHLQIFNRWGKEVFESFDVNNSWTGIDQNAGTYYYVLEVKGTNDEVVPFSGFVTLIK